MKEKVNFFGKPNYQFQYFLVKQLLENILNNSKGIDESKRENFFELEINKLIDYQTKILNSYGAFTSQNHLLIINYKIKIIILVPVVL